MEQSLWPQNESYWLALASATSNAVVYWLAFRALLKNNEHEFHSPLAMGQCAGRYVIKNSWG